MQVSLDSLQITASKALQSMRLTNHVTLNFNNEITTTAVFLDIEKALSIPWLPGSLYKLSKLPFSTSLNNLICLII
jgi:hypothetical protein